MQRTPISLSDGFAGLGTADADVPGSEPARVYAHALRRGSIVEDDELFAAELGLGTDRVRAAVAHLKELHLLREERGTGGATVLFPVDPDVAQASLILPIDEEVHRRRATISRLRQRLNDFRPHYLETRRSASDGDASLVELRDADELAGHLYLAAEHCSGEYVALLPNGLLSTGDETSARVADGALGLLARGVRVRLLLQHAVRSDIRARKVLTRLHIGGAEIRTTGELGRQLVAFDEETAFLLNEGGGADESAGVMIHSRSAVGLLLDLVECTWSGAQQYSAEESGYRTVADSLHLTIVQLLADGLTDEAVARRLGISVRTCRRHIAAVLRDLDAVSRFQAGVRVGAARQSAPPVA
ncbi:helix-turn-helix domain-containing protein [Streptomyces sp. NPDC048436]|uniref:helix-turn-helix transcriptional regulator n=1 Tax=Streptomyces sp. NPDC048436 TaxID=3365550 RepID=UPI003715D7F5